MAWLVHTHVRGGHGLGGQAKHSLAQPNRDSPALGVRVWAYWELAVGLYGLHMCLTVLLPVCGEPGFGVTTTLAGLCFELKRKSVKTPSWFAIKTPSWFAV